MISVAECVTIRARGSARWPIRFLVVTNSTRRNLTARIRFARRRVARVAIVMGRDVRGDRQTHTAIDRRAVTDGTTSLRAC